MLLVLLLFQQVLCWAGGRVLAVVVQNVMTCVVCLPCPFLLLVLLQLKELLQPYGQLKSLTVAMDAATGKNKVCGYP
jgi:hypothetical protein